MPDLTGIGREVSVVIKAYNDLTPKLQKTMVSVNRLLLLSYQKRGGTFIYCTWKKTTGKHSETKCNYKTRIVRGGAKKMRHHFAKEHLREI